MAEASRDLPATEQASWGTGGEEEVVLGEERAVLVGLDSVWYGYPIFGFQFGPNTPARPT
jgi:hypothetical protein